MGHYQSNLRDIEFSLFEVLRRQDLLGREPYADLDEQAVRDILDEVNRLASGPIADSFAEGDRNPPVFDPETSSVRVSEPIKESFRALMDAQWYRLSLPAGLGGTGAPRSLAWSVAELILGANAAVWMYAGGPSFANVLWHIGTPEQRRFAELAVEREWGATMVLTEPDAGSDVGAGLAKAVEQPDGSWHIEGVKRFITSAEHDMAENIFHLVLARPEGHGPGTKGLSMFLVPKYLVNDDGSLGERNGVMITNVEHKMGLKASTTCEVTFGAGQPAVGTESQLTGRGDLQAHLVLDVGDLDAVAFAQRAVLVHAELGHEEHRQALGPRAGAVGPGEHEVEDVLCHVVFCAGDEALDTFDVPGPVRLLDRPGAPGAHVRAGVRLGQHHRGAPLPLDGQFGEALLLRGPDLGQYGSERRAIRVHPYGRVGPQDGLGYRPAQGPGRHCAAKLRRNSQTPPLRVHQRTERPAERLRQRHAPRHGVKDGRVAVGVDERLSHWPDSKPVDLGEHVAGSLLVDLGKRAGAKDLLAAEHLEEVELDVPEIALVVAHVSLRLSGYLPVMLLASSKRGGGGGLAICA